MTSPKQFTIFHYPMRFSYSPLIHTLFGEQFQIPLTYTQTVVEAQHLKEAVVKFREAGGCGANITTPLKEKAYQICDNHTDRCKQAGSTNTFFWKEGALWGDNTDGVGLIQDITINHQRSLADKKICILGAGGAVNGILGPLLAQNPKLIVICNRTLARARALCERFPDHSARLQALDYIQCSNAHAFDWIINALPSDFQDLPLEGSLVKNALVYDLSYAKNKKTDFIAWALQQGAKEAFDGLGMLVEQAAESFLVWNGVFPETQPVITHLKSLR